MVSVLSTAPEAAQWLAARVRGHLHTDSRAVQPGDGFIAWPGHATDGRRFVPAAPWLYYVPKWTLISSNWSAAGNRTKCSDTSTYKPTLLCTPSHALWLPAETLHY